MADDRIKTMRFEHTDNIPVSIGILPAAWMLYRDELDYIIRNHPSLFGEQGDKKRDYDAVWSDTYHYGSHVDKWGCVWTNIEEGMESIVTGHPIPNREDIHTFKPPTTIDGSIPHGFMFLRLTDLRGFEEAMVDFAEEPEELQLLIDMVLDHNMKELEFKLKNYSGDKFIYFGDDLGMQTSLPTSPDTWRKYLKPCYMKMYQRTQQAGLYIYMHTDGHIHEIIPDLVECGVDVINPQIRANGIDNLVRVCKGKVCVDLDLDRQLFPFCTPADIDDHIHESVEKLGSPNGGLWLKAEIGNDVPLENIEAICVALEKYRGFYRN
jgi:uroporphyrinogen decarboxylase